ncbi:MAG: low molecular weight phosphotyrosine protein phosphatase [Clostridia bacterium]|nr:low molecular weight phosphotyrosine protein phosphatase [Clostridia bacterium]
MYKIMFVCHGNICRSPMAEFVLKDLVKKAGREEEFFISSSAVSEEEIWGGVGNPVYPPVKKLLATRGIFCEEKRATLLTAEDGERYDEFLCMDESNLRRARAILGEKNGKKCRLLLNGRAVADPWYTRDFEATYRDVLGACAELLKKGN